MSTLQSELEQMFGNIASNDSWKGICAQRLNDILHGNQSAANDILRGVVDREGNLFARNSTPFLGGITYQLCDNHCGFDKIPTVFNFEVFSSGATNYLLPWVALTAQLPFEAGENEIGANIMSFCYAVGSPMLITYSLMITILNRHWVRNTFRHLETAGGSFGAKTKNVRIFLQECQQIPLRLSQQNGHLTSLIMLPENKQWWKNLKASIIITRRGVTLSLVAQILVAVLSWVLTIISAFMFSLGHPSQALVLSSGSLWVWLVPVVCGWISVGTQKDSGSIERALRRDKPTIVVSLDDSNTGDQNILQGSEMQRHTFELSFEDQHITPTQAEQPWAKQTKNPLSQISQTPMLQQPNQAFGSSVEIVPKEQRAFQVAKKTGRLPSLPSHFPPDGPSYPNNDALEVPNCLGFSVAGDEMQEGPAFNFARVFTWWNMANHLYNTLKVATRNLEDRRDLNLKTVPSGERFEPDDLKGDPLIMSRYCGLASDVGSTTIETKELSVYPSWGSLNSDFYKRITIAILVAIYVQWGTTSAAVIIAILTKVEGLGCRSGGYLLYSLNSTVAFALILASTIFSHAAMLQHQTIHHEINNSADCRPDEKDPRCRVAATPFPTFFRVCAVVTRLSGRVLVVLNTLWILISSLFELVGFYNNCWCEGLYLSRGGSGWIFLFDDGSDLQSAAQGPWAGSVFLSLFVGISSFVIVWLYCRGNRV
ncbi:hypothetical protein F5X99DRAFT_104600 [Biscogniauxia marginata]|nr:hypothetical protein F5X99DRAFT_104600 [Biscogniauxia marginata]